MNTATDFAMAKLKNELQEKLDTYIRLAEVCKRTIAIEEQQIKNCEAQILLLRETLQSLKAPRLREL